MIIFYSKIRYTLPFKFISLFKEIYLILLANFNFSKRKRNTIPVQECARMGFEMLKLHKELIENSIKRTYPHFSPIKIKLKVFEEMYKNDFREEQMQAILEAMRI